MARKKAAREASGQQQKQVARAAEQRMFNVCNTFNEIQSGPNPLTQAEIEKLIAKRPDVYGVLRACSRRRS
jgi:hypothetical protein